MAEDSNTRGVHVVYSEDEAGMIDADSLSVHFGEITALRLAVQSGGKVVFVRSGQTLGSAINKPAAKPAAKRPKSAALPETPPVAGPQPS